MGSAFNQPPVRPAYLIPVESYHTIPCCCAVVPDSVVSDSRHGVVVPLQAAEEPAPFKESRWAQRVGEHGYTLDGAADVRRCQSRES